MWSRKDLKDKAKRVLRETYWSALGVSLVIALVGGNHGSSSLGNSHHRDYGNSFSSLINDNNFIFWDLISFAIPVFLIILALSIFIGSCLEVGGRKYFIQTAQNKDAKNCFSFGFDGNNYFGIVKTMLLTNVLIFLWSLLLIIPGIIKSYAYRMVPYILADNPNIGAEEAISLSNEMTRGHKFDMFILDLSFIGWYLLGSLALGVGIFFVMPYENATNAELYLVLREEAIINGLCSYDDLLLDKPEIDDNNDI